MQTINQNSFTSFIETKEQYITMRQAWATFINSEAARPTTDTYGTRHHTVAGWHFLMYAILRGKDGRSHFSNDDSHLAAIATLKQQFRWNSGTLKTLFGLSDETLAKARSTIEAL